MKLLERFAGWRMTAPQDELLAGLQVRMFAGAGHERGAVIINWRPFGQALDWIRLMGDCAASTDTLLPATAADLDAAVQEKSVANVVKPSINVPGLAIMAIACN